MFLHGLAGTAEVWRPLLSALEERWEGEWLLVDLAGHGRSPWRGSYSIGAHAADVADAVGRRRSVIVVGHSMGGAVGLALASGWFGLEVDLVVAAGVKVEWSAGEVKRARDLAERPPREFLTHREAASFWLRLAGLDGLWEADAPTVAPAVVERRGNFTLTFDNRANEVAGSPIRSLLSAVQGRVVLVRGSRDPLVSDAQLRELGHTPLVVGGAGHNVHVEAPRTFADVLLAQISLKEQA